MEKAKPPDKGHPPNPNVQHRDKKLNKLNGVKSSHAILPNHPQVRPLKLNNPKPRSKCPQDSTEDVSLGPPLVPVVSQVSPKMATNYRATIITRGKVAQRFRCSSSSDITYLNPDTPRQASGTSTSKPKKCSSDSLSYQLTASGTSSTIGAADWFSKEFSSKDTEQGSTENAYAEEKSEKPEPQKSSSPHAIASKTAGQTTNETSCVPHVDPVLEHQTAHDIVHSESSASIPVTKATAVPRLMELAENALKEMEQKDEKIWIRRRQLIQQSRLTTEAKVKQKKVTKRKQSQNRACGNKTSKVLNTVDVADEHLAELMKDMKRLTALEYEIEEKRKMDEVIRERLMAEFATLSNDIRQAKTALKFVKDQIKLDTNIATRTDHLALVQLKSKSTDDATEDARVGITRQQRSKSCDNGRNNTRVVLPRLSKSAPCLQRETGIGEHGYIKKRNKKCKRTTRGTRRPDKTHRLQNSDEIPRRDLQYVLLKSKSAEQLKDKYQDKALDNLRESHDTQETYKAKTQETPTGSQRATQYKTKDNVGNDKHVTKGFDGRSLQPKENPKGQKETKNPKGKYERKELPPVRTTKTNEMRLRQVAYMKSLDNKEGHEGRSKIDRQALRKVAAATLFETPREIEKGGNKAKRHAVDIGGLRQKRPPSRTETSKVNSKVKRSNTEVKLPPIDDHKAGKTHGSNVALPRINKGSTQQLENSGQPSTTDQEAQWKVKKTSQNVSLPRTNAQPSKRGLCKRDALYDINK